MVKSDTPEYKCWQSMIQRCHNPSSQSYHLYGKRGITVCEMWRNSFDQFLLDMGNRPDGMSLDRINNNDGYTPQNCRWATTKQQNRNRRGNVLITYMGKTQTVVEWSEEIGVHQFTINQRHKQGLPLAEVFSQQKFVQHKLREDNQAGFIGVSKVRSKWKAQLQMNGMNQYLGLFDDPESAHKAYLSARSDALRSKNNG